MSDFVEQIIDSTARAFGARGKFHGADADDFRQEMRAWLFRHHDSLVYDCVGMSRPEFERYLARCLQNVAIAHLNELRKQTAAASDARMPKGRRDRDVMGRLLRTILNPNASAVDMAALSVAVSAFARLDADDRKILRDYYVEEISNASSACERGISEPDMTRLRQRAVRRFREGLEEDAAAPAEPDPWRGRRAMSNAKARWMTSASYDGEDT